MPIAPTEPSPQKTRIPIGISHVSRRPAAIVGILIVTGFSYFYIQGKQNPVAQLKQDIEVHITEAGLQPASIRVEHGQRITWINEQDLPHILESQELCSVTGNCLYTRTLFRNDRDTFAITGDIPPGSYTYFSSTSGDLTGNIIVEERSPDIAAEMPPPSFENFLGQVSDQELPSVTEALAAMNDPPGNPPSNPGPPENPSPPDNPGHSGNPNPGAALPQNPYTVESGRFDSASQVYPQPGEFVDDPAPGFFESGGPMRQPETGMSIWLVAIGSIMGIYWVTRRCFQQG